VDPNDVPTEITKLVYTCPLSISKAVSQNQVAELLAHYWPAIEKHVREQVAQEALLDTNDPPADVCPLHSPAGAPCDCGHDAGADCHPGRRTT
jgi:hypothetical protein